MNTHYSNNDRRTSFFEDVIDGENVHLTAEIENDAVYKMTVTIHADQVHPLIGLTAVLKGGLQAWIDRCKVELRRAYGASALACYEFEMRHVIWKDAETLALEAELGIEAAPFYGGATTTVVRNG